MNFHADRQLFQVAGAGDRTTEHRNAMGTHSMNYILYKETHVHETRYTPSEIA